MYGDKSMGVTWDTLILEEVSEGLLGLNDGGISLKEPGSSDTYWLRGGSTRSDTWLNFDLVSPNSDVSRVGVCFGCLRFFMGILRIAA